MIHENAGNGQTRGHYGQEAERKSTGTIAVKFVKANKHFTISSKKARDTAHLDEVFFHFNSVGQVEQLGPATAAQRTVEAKTNELLALTIKAFEAKKMWKGTELKKWVAKELGQSEKTRSRRVEDMYKANYITDDKKGNFTSLIPIEQAPIFQFA